MALASVPGRIRDTAHAPVTHPRRTLSLRPSSPALKISGISKAISLRNGRPFPQLRKGSPLTPIWDQATELFFRFVCPNAK